MNTVNREVSAVKALWAAPERKQNTICTVQAKCTLLHFTVYCTLLTYFHIFSLFLGSGISLHVH